MLHPDERKYSDDPAKAERQRKRQEREYEVYSRAKKVWGQISEDERAFVLQSFGYRDVAETLKRDANHDLKEIRLLPKHLRFIRKYPRSKYRQVLYKGLISGKKPVRDKFYTAPEYRAIGRKSGKKSGKKSERVKGHKRRQKK